MLAIASSQMTYTVRGGTLDSTCTHSLSHRFQSRCVGRTGRAAEDGAEQSAESFAHGAVDEQVERIRDGDAAVNEQSRDGAKTALEEFSEPTNIGAAAPV